jgi:hypothetical protein
MLLEAGPDASIRLRPATSHDIRITEARGSLLRLTIESDEGGFLVISKICHQGWQATLDGDALALHRTNVALPGAWIPAGEH